MGLLGVEFFLFGLVCKKWLVLSVDGVSVWLVLGCELLLMGLCIVIEWWL